MTEKLLQYIWQFQHFNRVGLQTTGGESVQVIFQGGLNKNQGPDFTDAKIRIGSTVFAGTVELHCKTSEWQKHGHQNDPNYTNVILHVVFQNDVTANASIPVLELQPHVSNIMLQRYEYLMTSASFIPCANAITSLNDIVWLSWKERLLAERLTRKADKVLELLWQSNNHWEEVFWWLLARNFGAKVNADAFEAIARSLLITILAKQKHSIHQLEALLLGQAGLLEGEMADEYPKLLQREYAFLRSKYKLAPIKVPVYFLRMRPGNFPTIRLAQLAMLIFHSSHLFSKIREEENLQIIKSWLNVTANDYWHYHYHFHQAAAFKKKNLGASMTGVIIINTIIPALFAFGLYHKDERYKAKALRWLEETAPENNSILKGFDSLQLKNKSAFDSQALIELKNEYCNKKRCLECSVGISLLKRIEA
jgi:hypothetical protein